MSGWLERPLGFFLYLKLNSNQWKSPLKLEKFQIKKIQRLIDYIKRTVPFYQTQLSEKLLQPDNFNSLQEIEKFPVITKDNFNQNFGNFISNKVDPLKCVKINSSGSTGQATTMLYDKLYQIYNRAFDYRYKSAIGIRARDKRLNIEDSSYFPKINSFSKHIAYSRNFFLSVFEDPSILVPQIQRINPTVIYGPPSLMEALAHYVEENNIQTIIPRRIVCTNEVLDSKAREVIERVFNTQIFDFYGCTEIPHVAWECESHTGFHINMDNVLVEIIKDGTICAPHKIGQIIITSFHNHAIPLIRYDTGDLGAISDELCPCGRKFPLLKKVYGRTNDLLHLPNGKITHPWILINALKAVLAIKQLQIIQQKLDLIEIKIVEKHSISSSDEEKIISIGKKTLGTEIVFKISKVSKIDRGIDRKFHVVISKLHSKK